jgi:rod shape-determining protein MreD
VLLTVLLAHVAVAPHLALRGVAPDVLLVGVAAVAVARGPRAGAAFGFAAGLGADLFLAQPVGTSALAFTLIGHVIGRSSGPRSPGAAARRLALSRSIVLTAAAVGTGRLAAAVVATGLGGVPFLDAAGLLRIVTTAAVSASLGPVLFAAVRRLPGATAPR